MQLYSYSYFTATDSVRHKVKTLLFSKVLFLFYMYNKSMQNFKQVVMFNLEIGEPQIKSKDNEADHNKLEDMIKELATTLKTVKHEQEYMQVLF